MKSNQKIRLGSAESASMGRHDLNTLAKELIETTDPSREWKDSSSIVTRLKRMKLIRDPLLPDKGVYVVRSALGGGIEIARQTSMGQIEINFISLPFARKCRDLIRRPGASCFNELQILQIIE